jgi:hypothetical protein
MMVYVLAGLAALCGIASLLVYRRQARDGGNRTAANVSLILGVVLLAAAAGLLFFATGL